jgi:phage terminase large subunit
MGEVVLPAGGWKPRAYQLPFWLRFENPDTRRNGRFVLVWHRRAGKDLTSIEAAALATQERVGLYLHVFPYLNQGRKIVWNGRTGDGVPFLDAFPRELVDRKLDMDMRVMLKNGSIYQVMGADDPDKLVGINPVGVILSEFALFETDQVLRLIQPILAENGGWLIFPSTPRGRNHYFDLLHRVKDNPNWFISILGVDDTGVVSEEMIQEARDSGMPEPLVQQEFYVSFDAVLEGAYYEHEFNILAEQDPPRISDRVVYDPALPVNTAWDLGIDDETVVWYFQITPHGYNWFDLDHGRDKGMEWFLRRAWKKGEAGSWLWGRNFFPHDVEQRSTATGKQARMEIIREVGFTPTVVAKHSVEDGVAVTRRVLLKSWFSRRVMDGIKGLKAYRRTYDEKKDTFIKPRDDWASHYADSFRIGAVGAQNKKLSSKREKRQQYAITDYDPFGEDSGSPTPAPRSMGSGERALRRKGLKL